VIVCDEASISYSYTTGYLLLVHECQV
jgi:hypothetical protein